MLDGFWGREPERRYRPWIGGFESGCDLPHDFRKRCKTLTQGKQSLDGGEAACP
jgi:hypothetical protein